MLPLLSWLKQGSATFTRTGEKWKKFRGLAFKSTNVKRGLKAKSMGVSKVRRIA